MHTQLLVSSVSCQIPVNPEVEPERRAFHFKCVGDLPVGGELAECAELGVCCLWDQWFQNW